MEITQKECSCCGPACSCCGPPCSLVPATATEGSRELYWDLFHGAPFFKMSSLEQRLSRIEEKLKQENEEARRRIDLNIDMSPQRSRPRPSECPRISSRKSVSGQENRANIERRRKVLSCSELHAN